MERTREEARIEEEEMHKEKLNERRRAYGLEIAEEKIEKKRWERTAWKGNKEDRKEMMRAEEVRKENRAENKRKAQEEGEDAQERREGKDGKGQGPEKKEKKEE
jgi:hypothetical protein